jgi:hypothetical protein
MNNSGGTWRRRCPDTLILFRRNRSSHGVTGAHAGVRRFVSPSRRQYLARNSLTAMLVWDWPGKRVRTRELCEEAADLPRSGGCCRARCSNAPHAGMPRRRGDRTKRRTHLQSGAGDKTRSEQHSHAKASESTSFALLKFCSLGPFTKPWVELPAHFRALQR